jgi:hypothetical protein
MKSRICWDPRNVSWVEDARDRMVRKQKSAWTRPKGKDWADRLAGKFVDRRLSPSHNPGGVADPAPQRVSPTMLQRVIAEVLRCVHKGSFGPAPERPRASIPQVMLTDIGPSPYKK